MINNNTKLKELFEKRKTLAREFHLVSSKFDKELEKYYEFGFNETDDDLMIDTLDYGTSDISFEKFIEIMEHYKHSSGVPFACKK